MTTTLNSDAGQYLCRSARRNKDDLEITHQYTLGDAARYSLYRIDEARNCFLDSLRKALLLEG